MTNQQTLRDYLIKQTRGIIKEVVGDEKNQTLDHFILELPERMDIWLVQQWADTLFHPSRITRYGCETKAHNEIIDQIISYYKQNGYNVEDQHTMIFQGDGNNNPSIIQTEVELVGSFEKPQYNIIIQARKI